ncbi:hypothetical protein C8J57DRAFT_1490186 [Mycena rebaudengoi]|nr:hypothetical protein C8J57DRAFT_1490186 [Mycena rebaudengoi]
MSSPEDPSLDEEPVPIVEGGEDGGDDSDEYDEEFDGEDDEDEDEEEGAPAQSGLTALLLGNRGAPVVDEEEGDDDDDDDEYVEGSANAEAANVAAPSASASKKRGIEDVAAEDDQLERDTNGDVTKKAKRDRVEETEVTEPDATDV